jgi:hypothetical protein
MTNNNEYHEYGLSDEFFFTTEEEARAALEKANTSPPAPDNEDGLFVPPEGQVFRCTRDDSFEGIAKLGEGDEWCVIDESGENMVTRDGTWVNVS